MADHDSQGLHQEFEFLKGVELRKNELIQDLLNRIDKLSLEYQSEKLDHARERKFNRDNQLQEQRLQEELRSYKTLIERDAFILVLIDGDGMIFDDNLIKQGEIGGGEAAVSLSSAVRDYVHQTIPDISSDYKVVTRVYANLKGLGDVCHKAGILTKPSTIEDFARGFTGSKHLFDFVDVGIGKDRADEKISEILKLDLHNVHCRHILFGCSHDNGYARLLQDVGDRQNIERITLLEGVPFERELLGLASKYRTTKFEGLFRTTKINLYQSYIQPLPAPFQSPSYPQNQQQPTYVQSAVPPNFGHPTPPYQHVQAIGAIQRPTSASTNGSTTKMNPNAATWASAAVSGPAQVASPPPTPHHPPSPPRIDRNKYHQRIDPQMTYDKDSVKRMRALHLCQNHFLRVCHYGDTCSNKHDYKPSKNELATLKVIARSTPCKFGAECDDAYCIYGHRCPLSVEGRKDCFWGAECWFPRELHGVEMKVVQVTKVGK